MNKLSLFTLPALILASCFSHASHMTLAAGASKAISAALPADSGAHTYIDFGTQADTTVPPFNAVVEVHAGPYLCTGTEIDPHTVLTAGHCVFNDDGTKRQPQEIFVSQKEGGWDSKIYYVTAIDTEYNPKGLDYDVAILTTDNTDESIPTVPVAPAYLTREWLSSKAPELIIAGYGIDRDKDYQLPGFLQKGTIKLTQDSYARKTLMQIQKDDNLHAWFDPKHNFATCSHEVVDHGDSGGPVFYKDAKGKFYLIGNTSWGLTESEVDENNNPVFISHHGCFDNSGNYRKDYDIAFFTDLTHNSINSNFVASLLTQTPVTRKGLKNMS